MEVTLPATATTTPPESDTEHPTPIQPAKPLSFTNGVLKRHRHQHHHSPPTVTYKECLKNHAATIGGHAVDGCGEFMPSPASLKCADSEPTSLTCAACGCHRNFHRREPDDSHPPAVSTIQHVLEYEPQHRHHPLPPPYSGSSPDSPSPPPISSSYYPSAPHMLLALSAGISTPPADSNPAAPSPIGASAPANPLSRKRFRTKFTQNQKEKMHEFADKIQWKIQRNDEARITDFCQEIGVDRGVLKVWMHNNKSILGKKDANNNGGEISDINQAKLSYNLNNNGVSSDGVVNTNVPSCSSS